MARQTRTDAPKTVAVKLPQECITYIHTRFHDPLKGKVKYGAVSTYVERLIREDMKRDSAVRNLAQEPADE